MWNIVMNTLLYLKWVTTRTYCTAQGTILNIMWQPGWEGSLGENGSMYMYGWVPSLFTWNYYNIVNQLYSNKIKSFYRKLKRKKIMQNFFFLKACLPHPWHLCRWIFILCVSLGKCSFLTPGNEQGLLWTQDMEERKSCRDLASEWCI